MSRTTKPTIRHWLEYFAYRIFEGLINLISLRTTFKLGAFIGSLMYRFSRTRRRQVIRNLTFAFGDEKSRQEITELAEEVFQRNGANFLSSLKTPFLSDQELLKHITFEGFETLDQEIAKGGVTLVSPHMGNWELLAQAIFLTGRDIQAGTHYRPLNNPLVDAVVARRRKRRGLHLFEKRTSSHRLISFVRERSVLAILADQRVGKQGQAGIFFGRPTTCSPLPHIIAKRARASLATLSCITTGTCQWKITYKTIPTLTAQGCADGNEELWRSSPSDVFWFEDRWRIQGKAALGFLGKYQDAEIPRRLRFVNLTSEAPPKNLPTNTLTLERKILDFGQSDHELQSALEEINDTKNTPVDVYICPLDQKARVKKLTNRAGTFSIDDLESISTSW